MTLSLRSAEDCLQLQHDIDVLEQWSETWLLSFNVTKCKILHIDDSHVVMFELFEDIRDLGICMDSKLKFHTHTDFTANNANCILGLISKVFECKDSDIMLELYKSLVHPLLEYNNAIWGPYYIMDKHKIEAIQRRATRMITTCRDLLINYTIYIYHLTVPKA